MRRLCLSLWLLLSSAPLWAQQQVTHGFFHDVALYAPTGDAQRTVLLLSDGHGWDNAAARLAQALVRDGALVAGIDSRQLRAAFAKDRGACAFPDGDLENLSHYLQGYARLSDYRAPVLVGLGDGAAVAYAVATQAPRGVFAGVVTQRFVPRLDLGKPPCKGGGTLFDAVSANTGSAVTLRAVAAIPTPWLALSSAQHAATVATFTDAIDGAATRAHGDSMPALLAGVRALARVAEQSAAPPPAASVRDLPLIEVAAHGVERDVFAVLLSGDGGWAGLDTQVAAALAARGIPVVGFDSLRYFWSARTPDGLAHDLDRVIGAYQTRWHKSRVLLIGYSQGADVLPFALNRLPPATRAQVARTVLMGAGTTASFEFHVSNWLSAPDPDALPIAPEIQRLHAGEVVCIDGQGDDASGCARYPPGHVTVHSLPGGHHFGGDYERLAGIILAALPATHTTPSR